MKQRLESIVRKAKKIALMHLMLFIPLELNAQSLKHYIEPRIGLIIPMSAKEQTYNPSIMVGGAYGFKIGRFGLEAGVDYFKSSEEYIETKNILPRVNVKFNLSKPTVKVEPYLMAGANILIENSTINLPRFNVRKKVSNTTLGLEFGTGAIISKKIHLGASYTLMPGSENVKSRLAFTAGYRFSFESKK